MFMVFSLLYSFTMRTMQLVFIKGQAGSLSPAV